MNFVSPLDRLKNAKVSDTNWQEIAHVLREGMENQVWRESHQTPSAWLEDAAEKSGYSTSMLRRMIALDKFLHREKKHIPELAAVSGEVLPFAILEIFKRVYDADPITAKGLAARLVAGDLKVSEIRKIQTELTREGRGRQRFIDDRRPLTGAQVMSHSLGRMAARDFAIAASEAVEAALEKLGNADTVTYHAGHFKFRYASPDAVAIGRNGLTIKWIDAYDFKAIGRIPVRSRYNQLLAETTFNATFFRNYWLVIPEESSTGYELAKDLQNLECGSVGVMTYDETQEDPIKVLLMPETRPSPDRTAVTLGGAMQQGIPGIAMF